MIYSNWLREKSHNAIKFGEAAGNPCVLKYSKGKKLKNYEIYGNSVQETRSGKNILPYPPYAEGTKTENNITFTDNGDGTITVNGTASADTTFNLCTDLVLTAGTYTFSGCSSGGSNTTYFISGFTGTDIGSGFTVVLDSDTTGSLSITIKYGTTISNKIFKPQIEVGSEKTSYEQYGVMPSPDFPSEIQSVGDLTTKNLFDKDKTKYKVFMQSDTIISNSSYYTIFIDVENISNFTISIKNGQKGYYGLCDSVEVGSEIYKHSYFSTTAPRIITNNTHKYLGISIWHTAISAFADVQVEEGDIVTEYEPYHKYDIPIDIFGKNLLIDYSLDYKYNCKSDSESTEYIYIAKGNEGNELSWSSGELRVSVKSKCRIKEPITLSFYVTLLEQGIYSNMVMILAGSASNHAKYFKQIQLNLNERTQVFMTITPKIDIDRVSIRLNSHKLKVEFGTLQIEYGTTATEYEPYVSSTQHIYLDEPLRKVGEYSDYIDFRNKKVVRNIQKNILDGTENWRMEPVNEKEYNNFYTATNPKAIARTDILSNKTTGNISVATRAENNGFISFSTKLNITYLIDTVDNWKTLLSTWYTEGNPLIVNYILATPIEEPIDNLPDIITNNREVCIIRTDTQVQPSNIKVKYIRV